MQDQIIEGYRLSPQQKRLWFLEQACNGMPFRAQCALLIEGRLDQAALTAALELVLRRNHVLSTTFRGSFGLTIPVQVVGEPRWQLSAELDFRNLAHEARNSEIERLLREAKQSPFDYELGPTVHVSQARLAPDQLLLAVTLPALCADSIGLRNIACEIARSYDAIVSGKEVAEEPMPYIVASEWLNDLFETEDFEVGESFWRKHDVPDIQTLKLPFGRRSEAERGFEPRVLRFVIGPGQKAKMEAVVRRFDASISLFLQTCWHLLIGRLTEQSEIIIGAGYDGRSEEEMEGIVGLFAKYLPIRSYQHEGLGFGELLRRIKASTEEVRGWQEWFTWDLLGAPSDQTGMLFFPICFDFEPEPMTYRASGATFTICKHDSCIDRFELKLRCVSARENVIAELHYNSALFAEAEIELLAGQYLKLVESALDDPEAAAGDLDLLSDDERRRLTEDFNKTWSEYPRERRIHKLFEEQVARTPDSVAVIYDGHFLSFFHLNTRANQLAHLLCIEGVRPETLVSVCLHRSLFMPVAILAVLKAGAGFVPLDPFHPADRLAYILRDSRASVLLTQQALSGKFTDLPVRIICLDRDWGDISRHNRDNPNCGATAENLAYVIYTSGSTGRPKGVMIEHHSPVNLLTALTQAVYVDLPAAPLIVSLNAPLAFDASVQQLVMLIRGDAVHIIPQEIRTDGESLISYLALHGVDVFDCTPSQLEILLEAGFLGQDGSRPRAVLIAGEAIDEGMWKKLAGSDRPRFYNIYGPTECTVDATYCPVDEMILKPSIGRPLANYQVYIADPRMRPTPTGASGEVYIGGEGVARGYLNESGLTAERFVPDPFGSGKDNWGRRVYKSGDEGRCLSDGRIEYIGRLDGQVKLRGYRIELGEVESALQQHAAVKQCVVCLREDSPGDKRLVAYVAPSNGTLSSDELREYLQGKLPEYMVPWAFVEISQLPLTSNGKLDRQALPAPEGAGVATVGKGPSQELRTPIEEITAGILADVIRLESVGVDENFFELGGHSLLATQVVSRVREAFNVEVALREIFERPTVRGLAEAVEREHRAGRMIEAPPIRPVERRDEMCELPLSYAQQRLWFIQQLEPESAAYNLPYAVKLRGALGLAAVEQSLQQIARRHEALRTRFVSREGQPVQVIDELVETGLPLYDLGGLSPAEREQEAREIAAQEAIRPFDLERGPVWRAGVVRIGAEEHVLLLSLHHVASDGWSMGILVRELTELYQSYREGRSERLAELEAQYADFAVWQRQWLRGEVLEEQMEYWRAHLAGAPVLKLPTDRPRPATASGRSASAPLSFSAELTRKLRELCRREEVTLFMTLLSALQIVLGRYAGQDDVVVGADVANRNRLETEGLIGFFVNQLVLRTDLSGNPSLREVLRRVRQTTLKAYQYQDVPFEKIVEELVTERRPDRSPLFQVKLVLQNVPRADLRVGGVEFSEFGADYGNAKRDLTLFLTEGKDGVYGKAEYAIDLFDRSTIDRLLYHLRLVLERMVEDRQRGAMDPHLLNHEHHQDILKDLELQAFKQSKRKTLNPIA
jgi:amino acid adenylation domain-containing protein